MSLSFRAIIKCDDCGATSEHYGAPGGFPDLRLNEGWVSFNGWNLERRDRCPACVSLAVLISQAAALEETEPTPEKPKRRAPRERRKAAA
jgi:hypothetical protein